MLKLLRDNAYLAVAWLTAAGVFIAEHAFHNALETVPSALLLAWLFGVILWGAFTVVHHSEVLAERLGEPYGTLVLTLSVTIIEVSIITAALLHAEPADTLVRDTVFAVVMITLNGIAGLCLLLGAIRHGEQEYNLRGAQAFLSVIIPLTVLALVLPNFTVSTPGPTLSHFQSGVLAALTIALYGVFLTIQTVHHRSFFEEAGTTDMASQSSLYEHAGAAHYRTWVHTVLLVLSLLPIIYLAEQLAALAREGVAAAGGPEAVVGVMIAVLVLSPEGLGAVYAAMQNRLQRAINITLGSALATVSLTIPAVLIIGILTDRLLTLGLSAEEMVLLFLTIVAAMLTFGGVRTNVLQGLVQLVLFAVFLALLFDP
jgi:Ca2+:H+ antiporter